MRSRRAANSSRGFTLLEVLAAVAILGVWYVILAAVAIQGLRAQGESQRRLEASFLADEAIAEIEAGLNSGNAPDEEVKEYERDDYVVRIEVLSYSLDLPPLESGSSSASAASDSGAASLAFTNLLGGASASGESPLRSVHIEVSWTEGHDERSVIRDTYAFDLESVRSELASLEDEFLEATDAGDPGPAGSDTTTPGEAQLPEAGL